MASNLILLQREDLKEVLAEIVEEIVGKSRQVENCLQGDGEYLSRDELCKRLHITYSTLWRMEKRGDIRAVKVGRRSLYSCADVNLLLKNQR